MIKKLLTIFLLATITLTTIMPEDVLARGRRGAGRKAVAAKSRVTKASRSARGARGSRSAVVRGRKGNRYERAAAPRGRGRGRYIAARGRGRGARYTRYSRRYEPAEATPRVVSRAPGVAIPPDRVREIQTALKREGYLQAEPSGQYDRSTVEAMTKYQQDNNFRTTGYPTAETLQKLGLTRQRRVTQPPPGENKTSDSSSTPPQAPSPDSK